MNSSPAAIIGEPGPFGYTLVREGDGYLLRDSGVRPVARWHMPKDDFLEKLPFGLGKRLEIPTLVSGGTAHVELLGRFAMPVQLYNGKTNAMLRSSHNGWLQLGPRRYTITHHLFLRTDMRRDGRLILRGRGHGRFRKQRVSHVDCQDELDQLATELLWHLFGLGREGPFGGMLDFDPF